MIGSAGGMWVDPTPVALEELRIAVEVGSRVDSAAETAGFGRFGQSGDAGACLPHRVGRS